MLDYILPAPETLPTLKEIQYVQSKDDYKETHLSEKEQETLYDNLLYQIVLRTIHEMFEADAADALDIVAFNGIVTALDKTTGHNVTACILTVLARKESFMEINLASIDPKACFKSLKGVAASKLAGLSAVSPVMMIDKNDRRFVAAYGVADYINEATNLATMDWEDFEHLIRELFEQEFATGGGEVKVTQASRDGGVDAVAFDPDPIRGGKIVIQAKRYANTVGVSAVRDLYGTVMNEGALKGLLVTTADYGPDAYEFAKGKPLTLLNGSNLLHLLEKHGHKARINLNEAKQENKQALAAGFTRKRNIPTEPLDAVPKENFRGHITVNSATH
jgi:restriction system protein